MARLATLNKAFIVLAAFHLTLGTLATDQGQIHLRNAVIDIREHLTSPERPHKLRLRSHSKEITLHSPLSSPHSSHVSPLSTGSTHTRLSQWAVHLQGPVTNSGKKHLAAAVHPHLLGPYLPHHTYVVLCPTPVARSLFNVPGVLSVLHFHPALKIAPQLSLLLQHTTTDTSKRKKGGRRKTSKSPSEQIDLRVMVLTGSLLHHVKHSVYGITSSTNTASSSRGEDPNDTSSITRLVALWRSKLTTHVHTNSNSNNSTSDCEVSVKVIDSYQIAVGIAMRRSTTTSSSTNSTTTNSSISGGCLAAAVVVVEWLAAQEETHWIEKKSKFRTMNKWANIVIQTDTMGDPFLWKKGLQGQGQVVAVGDTGLDYDSCFFYDPDRPVPINKTDFQHR